MRSALFLSVILGVAAVGPLGGCETEPKSENRDDVAARGRESVAQFKRSGSAISDQIARSAGYVIFPDVAQAGFIVGGTGGKGIVCKPDGTQIGWASLSSASVGLQAGVQGFRMLVIFENEATLQKFKDNQLSGQVGAVAVASDSGASAKAPFKNGVAVYQGANRGLMAGVDLGLDYMKYKPL